MKLHIVIIDDRHYDVKVFPFTERKRAEKEASVVAKLLCEDEGGYYEALDSDTKELRYIEYDIKGGTVSIVEAELDAPVFIV